MATQKYTLLLATAFALFQSYAQKDVSPVWKDSSKIAPKSKAQFGEFSRNAYQYPARPKDMWEIGASIGFATLAGDLEDKVDIGASITARKSLSHTFSLRPYLSYYKTHGIANPSAIPKPKDYKTTSWGLGMDAIASLTTISNYRGNPKFNVYILAGFGFITANVQQKNATTGNYEQYYQDYSSGQIIGSLGDKNGHRYGPTAILTCFNIGGGIAYKISPRVNVAIESKNSLTNYDYFDGASSQFSNAFDAFWFHQFRFNYNIGNSSKRVEPLWWINPNNYVYSELNTPEHIVPKFPIKLKDADGDGIADQFDLEPNTPAGVSVDARGRALDTDGDGVPDYKDKELLTRQECFPVNADGVGTCPETPCCKESKSEIIKLQQTIDSFRNGLLGNVMGKSELGDLPSIVFKNGGTALDNDSKKLLDAVAADLKNHPNAKIKVLGHPEANKASQQKAYDRVESIIKYLVDKKGISENRFIFAYDAGGTGDGNTIDLQGTTEEGPNTVPAPAPHLKGTKSKK